MEIVDLEVPRSIRGGGTNKISGLQPSSNTAEKLRHAPVTCKSGVC